jgi:alpha-tubulin suppressor-like RCC1 family protein
MASTDARSHRKRRVLLNAALAAVAVALSLPSTGGAAAPPTGEAGASIATAPPGTIAGSVSAGDTHGCGVRTDGTLACWGDNSSGQASPPAGSFSAVSAGAFHSCGLRTDGTLACWGDNGAGQASPPAGSFSAVSAGSFHSCGVRTEATLACWGDNSFGLASSPAGTFTAVSVSGGHSCALRTDGTLACWGFDIYGETSPPAGTFTAVSAGDNHTCAVKADSTLACWGDDRLAQASPPVGTFTGVSAGSLHSCGVRTDGALACWGLNLQHQASPPAGTFTAASAGSSYSCGVRTEGTLACWGDNSFGEAEPPAGTFANRAVATGRSHTCGLRTDGTMSCWGLNGDGQASPPAGTFTAVSAGGLHTCGLRTDGTLACWGSNTFAEASPPAGTFVEVNAGSAHNCAVRTDGTLACWGSGGAGQTSPPAGTFSAVATGAFHSCGLRTNATVSCWGFNLYDQATSPAGTFTAVSAGSIHTCGLRTDGTLACWGSNDYGQASPADGTFTAVSAGSFHTCGARTDGTLACWGRNDFGQASPPVGTFTAVSLGDFHSCAVRTDGPLVCWGANANGRLGAAPATPAPVPPSLAFARLPYSHTFSSRTGSPTGSFALTAGSLPPGLSLSSAGVLSGTPTTGGTFAFTVTASNGLFADASASFSITVIDDMTPPAITPAVSGTLGENGWYRSDVSVSWTVEERESPSTLQTSGCAATTITIETAGTTHTCEATSVGGSSSESTTIKRDTRPPTVTCASPDTEWHAADVSIACSAADDGSGLADAADASFSLSTSVPAGTETANASTGSRSVRDLAGNDTTAGPVDGIKVDNLAPAITIDAPTATTYVHNQAVAAGYRCTDGGSGVATCSGPVASGANIDTAAAGAKTFAVTASDDVGNTSSGSVSYTVAAAPPPPLPPPPPPAPAPSPPPLAPRPSLRLAVASLSVFGPVATAGCRMTSGPISSCRVQLRVGTRILARGARAQRGGRSLLVRLQLTAFGRRLLASRLGGVRALVAATGTAPGRRRSAAARTRAILAVERFTTPPGSWVPDEAVLTPSGRRFLQTLRGKLIAVTSARCDGYAAGARDAGTPGHALAVSLGRARVMCRSLRRFGVTVKPKLVAHGKHDPIASNAGESGRAENRRVEVTVTHTPRSLR